MGTHLRVLSEGYPMNTNMTRFRSFSKIFASLWTKVASALEGLKQQYQACFQRLGGIHQVYGHCSDLVCHERREVIWTASILPLLLLFCTFNEAIAGLQFWISASWGEKPDNSRKFPLLIAVHVVTIPFYLMTRPCLTFSEHFFVHKYLVWCWG